MSRLDNDDGCKVLSPKNRRATRTYIILYRSQFYLYQFFNNSVVKIVLHKPTLKFDFALEMFYFVTKFKEKVQEVSKILKSLQKVPNSKLPGV